jgi:TRAP-type C4-dicarboxylate transport system substrate-binding protein
VDNLRKAGTTVIELSPEQHKAFVDACASVYTTWEPKIGKALLDEFRATVAKAK